MPPKEINRYHARDAVVDSLTNALLVISDEHNCDLDSACDRLRDAMGNHLTSAYLHANGEIHADDFCPEGIVVVPTFDPQQGAQWP